jgi:hypothetical protein
MFYRFLDGTGKKYVFTPFANYIWDEATIATMNHQNPQPTYRGLEAIKFVKGLSDVTAITKVDLSDRKDQELFAQLIKPWMNYLVAINATRKHVVAGLTDMSIKLTPLYIIIDNSISAIQSYDYFWDDDPKFQSVFRDDMGGNHQWLFFWVNSGGRSGSASISEQLLPPILAILIPKWYKGKNQDDKLMALLNDYPRGSIPEFDKQERFIRKRMSELVSQGLEEQEAFGRVMREYERKIKAQDPEVYYPEYATMGFPHPRPDYRDERYK